MLQRIGNLKPEYQAQKRGDVVATKRVQYGKMLTQIRIKKMGDVMTVTALQFKGDWCMAVKVLELMMLASYSKQQLQIVKLAILENR